VYAKDLTQEAPRRWSERLDGIPWLPRLIDKARASNAGTLGTYLYGQSPMDTRCLHVLGLGHSSFEKIVAAANDDRGVIDAIAARDPEAIARGQKWARGFEMRNGPFLFVLDWDDGYVHRALHPVRPVVTALCDAVSITCKRLWPRRRRTTGS
jgi:hypothetical protein